MDGGWQGRNIECGIKIDGIQNSCLLLHYWIAPIALLSTSMNDSDDNYNNGKIWKCYLHPRYRTNKPKLIWIDLCYADVKLNLYRQMVQQLKHDYKHHLCRALKRHLIIIAFSLFFFLVAFV